MCWEGIFAVIGTWTSIIFIPYLIGLLASRTTIGCTPSYYASVLEKWGFGMLTLIVLVLCLFLIACIVAFSIKIYLSFCGA